MTTLYYIELKKGDLVYCNGYGFCKITAKGWNGYASIRVDTGKYHWIYVSYITLEGIKLATETERLLYG